MTSSTTRSSSNGKGCGQQDQQLLPLHGRALAHVFASPRPPAKEPSSPLHCGNGNCFGILLLGLENELFLSRGKWTNVTMITVPTISGAMKCNGYQRHQGERLQVPATYVCIQFYTSNQWIKSQDATPVIDLLRNWPFWEFDVFSRSGLRSVPCQCSSQFTWRIHLSPCIRGMSPPSGL
jgi:hypothetical protein